MFKKVKHSLQDVADVVIDFFEALLDMLVEIIQALDEEWSEQNDICTKY